MTAVAVRDRPGHRNSVLRIGNIATLTGDYPAAIESDQDALTLAVELADPVGHSEAGGSLAVTARLAGNFTEAGVALTALSVSEATGDRRGELPTLNGLGIVQTQPGWATAEHTAGTTAVRRGHH